MYCRRCGKEIPEDSLFCSYCGAKVKKEQEVPVVQTAGLEKMIMNMTSPEKVNCQSCGELLDYTKWISINTATASAIPDIISGRLFEVVCGRCGHKMHLMYPILFSDMDHKIMINYVMPDQIDEAVKSMEQLKPLGYRQRIVTTQVALREKTCIINSGLDDRLVELLKVYVVGQVASQLTGKDIRGIYFIPDEKQPRIELDIGGAPAYINVVMDGYRYLEEKYRDALACREDDLIVDHEWAKDFLESLEA